MEGLIKTAKAGKPVNEEEIPPMVAVGKPNAESNKHCLNLRFMNKLGYGKTGATVLSLHKS